MSEILDVARSRGRKSEAPDLWRGLVGAWPIQEGGGDTVFDVSGYGNHGTLMNMDPAIDWEVSQCGRALDFDGTNDVVYFPEIAIQPPITISAWVRLSAIDRYGSIVATGNMSVQNNCGAMLQARVTGAVGIGYGAGERGSEATRRLFYSANLVYDANAWVHLCGVIYSLGDNMALYVDGRSVQGTYNGTYDGAIGYDGVRGKMMHGNNNFVFGRLRLPMVHSRALSASEVQQLYEDPWAMFRRRPVLVAFPVAPPTGVAPQFMHLTRMRRI